MSPVGGDQLTVALNPSKLCTVVGRGTDLGAGGLKMRQINNTMHSTTQQHEKPAKIHQESGEIRVKGKKKKNNKKGKERKTIGRVHLVKKWIPSVLIGPVNQSSPLAYIPFMRAVTFLH